MTMKIKMKHMWTCLLLSTLVAEVALGKRTLKQPVINVGAGCADIAPGPPTNLKATPGDGSVTLSWDKPANGGCVSFYAVNAIEAGGALQTSFNPNGPFQQTSQFTFDVTNLKNGQKYLFIVTAVNLKYAFQAQSATTEATPTAAPPSPPYRLCSTWIRPSGPGNLRIVNTGTTSVEACWDVPTNRGCVDYYSVNVQPKGVLMTSAFLNSIKVQSGQCTTVNQLTPNTEYTLTVSSFSNQWNGGGSSSVDFKTK